ncbi:hypothetical protein [Microbacterium sp. T2.11-28]|uniref:hypothetical protein n=1 Tax=Microbacterium sp. T2.11-28 TaxID=3041169 RepID=UPI002477A184|nr:hypothetical protein [Microbacterium sp. T2.11-28]CAI9386088.1 hypothetical protein MICABA_00168 [Microbacterium sp. T2.11-28]
MARGGGSISLLVESPLQDVARALRVLPRDVRAQINQHTKDAANPIWFEETRHRAATRIKQRVLVNTARVSVTSRNVILKAGTPAPVLHGKKARGRNADAITQAAEFGGGANKVIVSRTAGGTAYRRRFGAPFGPPYRGGSVVYPAARDTVPRFASLWLQTTRRTIHEALEGVS